MKVSRLIESANPILFLHGEADAWLNLIWGAQIQATTDLISIGCQANVDGPTKVELGDMREVAWTDQPHFDGVLNVAGGTLTVSTVEETSALTVPAPERVRVKIWRSHARWPNKVSIGIEPFQDAKHIAPWAMPGPGERVAIVPPTDVCKSLFIAGGRVPDRWGGFNPWTQPSSLDAGVRADIARPVNLILTTERPLNNERTDFDVVLPTPDRALLVFQNPPGRPVFNVDVSSARTRVRVIKEAGVSSSNLRIVVSRAD